MNVPKDKQASNDVITQMINELSIGHTEMIQVDSAQYLSSKKDQMKTVSLYEVDEDSRGSKENGAPVIIPSHSLAHTEGKSLAK